MNNNLSPKPKTGSGAFIVAAIGLIASCIGIFAFVTGLETLPDIINSSEHPPLPSQTQQLTLAENDSQATTLPDELQGGMISACNPQPIGNSRKIPSDNPGVSVEMFKDANLTTLGAVIVRLSGANAPLAGELTLVYPAVRSISGQWTLRDKIGLIEWPGDYFPNRGYETDYNGEIIVCPIPSGDYVLIPAGAVYFAKYLQGTWGVPGLENELIPIPVEAGSVTIVSIRLAQLDVGVISPNGTAQTDIVVYAYCQTNNIAGAPVSDETRSGCAMHPVRKTDSRGVATFYLGSGTYFVEAEGCETLTDIHLDPAAYQEVIIRQTE